MPEVLFQLGKAGVEGEWVTITPQVLQQNFVRRVETAAVRALKQQFPTLELNPIDMRIVEDISIYLLYEFILPEVINLDDVVSFFVNEFQRYGWIVIQHGLFLPGVE